MAGSTRNRALTPRDRWFAANDFLVLRYWNNDVLQNLEGVLTALLETLHSPTRGASPHDGPRASAFALRPFLPQDTPMLAEIFRASVEGLTEDDYNPAQQEAWAAEADDLEALRRTPRQAPCADRHA